MGTAEKIAELLRAEGKTVEVLHGGKAGGGMDDETSIRRVGRNALCPCGSGKKYKRCCGTPEGSTRASNPEPARPQSTPEVFTDGIMEIDGELHSLANLKPPE